MKKKLLLMAMALMASVVTFADSWVPPTVTAEDGPVSKDTMYLYNVAAKGFLGMGNAWGTQASVRATDLCFLLNDSTTLQTVEGVESTDATRTGWTIMTASGTKKGKYVCNLGAAALYVDMASQNADANKQSINFFSIEKQESGYYRIRPIAADPTYGADAITQEVYDAQYVGWDGEGTTTISPNVDPGVTPNSCDWQFVTPANYAPYVAKYNLYCELVLADSLKNKVEGYSSLDYSSASAVYNNPESTTQDWTDAYTALAAAVRQAEIYAVLDGASEDNPKDASSLIVNADFSTGDISGWTCTFVSKTNADNVGYQGSSYTYGDVTISKFIEAWSNTIYNKNLSYRAIGDAELSQTLPSLPQGKYTLTCDAIAVQQDGKCSPVTGVQLFATGGDIDTYTSISTGNEKPEHFELTFTSTGGDVKLGLRTSNCTANWIAADNFTMTYYGAVSDPYKVALESYISELDEKYPEMDTVYAKADVKEYFTKTLDGAREATSDYQAVQTGLKAAADSLANSVADYATIRTALDNAIAKKKQIGQNENFADLVDILDDLVGEEGEWQVAYEEGTFVGNEAEAIADSVKKVIATFISENCSAGDDVTMLLDNPGFDKDFSSWDYTGTSPVWGGVTTQGHNTLGSMADLDEEAYSTWGGCAERYQAIFNMYQTIKNMPKGLYTFKCQGFDRDDLGGDPAELYATVTKNGVTLAEYTAALTDQKAGATEDKLYDADGEWYSDVAYGSLWVPNGMAAAMYHFHHKTGDNTEYDYTSSLNIVLTETSDIQVGVRINNAGHWVIFDDFKIVYQGAGASVYKQPIYDAIEKVEEAKGDGAPTLSYAAAKAAEDAEQAGIDAIKNEDEDACIAALQGLTQVLTTIKNSQTLVSELQKKYDYTNDIRMNKVEEEGSYNISSYMEMVSRALDSEGFATDQTIEDYIYGLSAEFTKYVMSDDVISGASETDSIDVTAVIMTPKASDEASEPAASSYGWETNPGNIGLDGTSFELYNQTYDFFQNIPNLAPGFYHLHVQGFYRNGLPDNVANAMNGKTYEVITYDTISTDPLQLDTIKTEKPYTIESESRLYAGDAETGLAGIMQDNAAYNELQQEGAEETINGEKTYLINSMAQAAVAFENDLYDNILQFEVKEGQVNTVIGVRKPTAVTGDWTIFTNWRLYYLGTTAPEEDPTTAIQGVASASTTANVIYDLTGRRVAKAQKGIFIVNGKKVIK